MEGLDRERQGGREQSRRETDKVLCVRRKEK